ncbi:MAG: hypothetical protein V1495_09290 [Pseudomonadota bacterium]
MKTWISCVAFLGMVFALSCGGGDGSGGNGPSIEFTKGAMGSLPSVYSSTAPTMSLQSHALTGTITAYSSLVSLFKQECQLGSTENYCPPTLHPDFESLMDPTRFEMGSLIGMVYHAQMYTGILDETCEGTGHTPMTVTAASYKAASTDASADPTRFILDNYSLYTCRDTNLDNPSAQTRMISTAADGSYQAALTTRYKYNTGTGGDQTDFFQVYVSIDSAGTPTFLAFNFASAEPHASRVILLTNLTNHKFALKYYVPSQTDNNGGGTSPVFYAVATGIGGYDYKTGTWYPGHYYVNSLDDFHAAIALCVDNEAKTFDTDLAACDTAGVPSSWTASDTDKIKTYLEISATDAGRIGPFLEKFATSDQLSDADDSTSADLYFPASLP